jgi:xylulokinase
LGVAFVAGIAGGLFADWQDVERFLRDRIVDEPDDAVRALYDRRYAVYRDLYTRLADLFPCVADAPNSAGALGLSA